jgi:uncharacterized protein (DUF2384 family)
MSKNPQQKPAAGRRRGPVRAYHDPAEPVGELSEWSAWSDENLSVADLRQLVWKEVVDLFEGDEAGARDWMTRPRIPLGNATPAEMLDHPEDIARLRKFIQQIQRGIIP